MLAIKKVEVIPLDENYGKIIDSFNTVDDKTKNAPSINAVEQYVATAKAGIDTDLEDKANADDVYAKGETYSKAEANDLLSNKQNTILSGTSEPSSSLGENGDIYLQYS